MRQTVLDCDEAAWCALAARFGASAPAGTFVALDGDLGAGKTTWVRAFAVALGVSGRVTSPTFVLLAIHEGGRLRLGHADWYRLADASELELLNLDDLQDGVLLVEWASRFPEAIPADHLHVAIAFHEPGRRVTLTAHGSAHEAWIAQVFG